jgi:hypothetical protein
MTAGWKTRKKQNSSPYDGRVDENERNSVGVRMTAGWMKGPEYSRGPDDGRVDERTGI